MRFGDLRFAATASQTANSFFGKAVHKLDVRQKFQHVIVWILVVHVQRDEICYLNVCSRTSYSQAPNVGIERPEDPQTET
jgi:hypothetical protein